ncbi:MAG TPA: hypothetical protein VFV86_07290 [Nitrososphaeraceae archaeon]|nr:hypothetical protein [Nitrososphaeraceae archaeon]
MISLLQILGEIKIIGKLLILRVDPRLNLFYFDTPKGNRAYYHPNGNGVLLVRWPHNDNNRASEEEIIKVFKKFNIKFDNSSHYLPIIFPQNNIRLEGKLTPSRNWQRDPRFYKLDEIKMLSGVTPKMVTNLENEISQISREANEEAYYLL